MIIFRPETFGARGKGVESVVEDTEAFRRLIIELRKLPAYEGKTVFLQPHAIYCLRRVPGTWWALNLEKISNLTIQTEGFDRLDLDFTGLAKLPLEKALLSLRTQVAAKQLNWATLMNEPVDLKGQPCRLIVIGDRAATSDEQRPSRVNINSVRFNGGTSLGFTGSEQSHAIECFPIDNFSLSDIISTDFVSDGLCKLTGTKDSTGKKGAAVKNVAIYHCACLDTKRSAIALQGSITNLQVSQLFAQDISDQVIDFEPTGDRQGPKNCSFTDIYTDYTKEAPASGLILTIAGPSSGGEDEFSPRLARDITFKRFRGLGGVKARHLNNITLTECEFATDVQQMGLDLSGNVYNLQATNTFFGGVIGLSIDQQMGYTRSATFTDCTFEGFVNPVKLNSISGVHLVRPHFKWSNFPAEVKEKILSKYPTFGKKVRIATKAAIALSNSIPAFAMYNIRIVEPEMEDLSQDALLLHIQGFNDNSTASLQIEMPENSGLRISDTTVNKCVISFKPSVPPHQKWWLSLSELEQLQALVNYYVATAQTKETTSEMLSTWMSDSESMSKDGIVARVFSTM